MSRKYKFYNEEGLYFVSFATIGWTDVFVRELYCGILTENLNFYSKKGMEIFAWCIMPSHLHLIFRDKNNQPQKILGNFKSYTSKQLVNAISTNNTESRRDWMMDMFSKAAKKESNVWSFMFWQHHNHPIEWSYTDIAIQFWDKKSQNERIKDRT